MTARAEVLRVPAEYTTIQAAIDAATNGDEVRIADGVYTGAGNRDLDFHGKLITVRSDNGPGNCIIDCKGTAGGPHRAFKFHSGETSAAVVAGLTIIGGHAPLESIWIPTSHRVPDVWSPGGAILNERGDLTVGESTIAGNGASSLGDAVRGFETSRTSIASSIIWDNSRDQGSPVSLESLGPESGALSIRFSDIEQGPQGIQMDPGWELDWGKGNFTADPRFSAPGSDDYRLTHVSPCINAGDPSIPSQAALSDLDGRDRLMCGRIDVGAYEFGVGDSNCDRRIDFIDLNTFVGCATHPAGGPISSACKIDDYDNDGDVDLMDVAKFQNGYFPLAP